MKIVTPQLLAQVTEQATVSARLRTNHNFHSADGARCHRLLNAIEPASYIRPHLHLDPEKDEAFILLQGILGVVTFSPEGEVEETVILSLENGTLAVDIPHGTYHTVLSLRSGTVCYEVKAGPYLPLLAEEKAPWAPEEHDPAAVSYLERLRRLFAGQPR
jgi:cupin fold WbuC family metalloprotein